MSVTVPWDEGRRGIWIGNLNGHRLRIEKKFVPDQSRIGYSIYFDGRPVEFATSLTSAKTKAIRLAEGRRKETAMSVAFDAALEAEATKTPAEVREVIQLSLDYDKPKRVERLQEQGLEGHRPFTVNMDTGEASNFTAELPVRERKPRPNMRSPWEQRRLAGPAKNSGKSVKGWVRVWEGNIPYYMHPDHGDQVFMSVFRGAAINKDVDEHKFAEMRKAGVGPGAIIVTPKLILYKVEDIKNWRNEDYDKYGSKGKSCRWVVAAAGDGPAGGVALRGDGGKPAEGGSERVACELQPVLLPGGGVDALQPAGSGTDEGEGVVSDGSSDTRSQPDHGRRAEQFPGYQITGLYGDNKVQPSHYQAMIHGQPVEVFDVLEAFGLDEDAYIAQAAQYILRSPKKGGVEDLEKAVRFLNRRIAKLKGEV